MKQGNRNNSFHSGYFILNMCRPNACRILVFVSTSSNHQTTNSRDEQRSLVVCRTLRRRSASATTCHRADTDYCDAPALLAQTNKLFSIRQASAQLFYLLTSVYVTHIQTSNLQYFILPNERPVSSVYALHYLVVGCKFRFCACRSRTSGMHFLLFYADYLLATERESVFCAFFQDLSLQEFRFAISATKTGTVRGLYVVVVFRLSCIHPLYITVGYRNDA
jgi:hypothetical protein